MKTERLRVCHHLLTDYESEGNDFLYRNVTCDKSRVQHYDLGLKSQSLEYPDPTSPRKKKFKTQPSLKNAHLLLSGTTEALITRCTWLKL